jgi:hypothetical protein
MDHNWRESDESSGVERGIEASWAYMQKMVSGVEGKLNPASTTRSEPTAKPK